MDNERENTEQLVTIKLSRGILKKIFLKNWDLLDQDTKQMLVVSGIVEVGPNVRL